jgi:hypothetical protein
MSSLKLGLMVPLVGAAAMLVLYFRAWEMPPQNT